MPLTRLPSFYTAKKSEDFGKDMERKPNHPAEKPKKRVPVSDGEKGSDTPAKAKKTKEKPRRELTHKTIVVRSRIVLVVMILALLAMCGRLAFLQILDPYDYAAKAVEQYTYEVKLEAKRGTIYAADGTTKLASSVTTQTVFISPADIYQTATEGRPDDPEDSTPMGEAAYLRWLAEGLAECLEDVDAQYILDKYYGLGESKLKYKYLVIKKDINQSEEDKVRLFISENDLELEIALEEGTKRSYGEGTLASHLLGFVGSDNNGLLGLEFTYDEYLSGVDGRAVRAQDANGNELAYNYESYIAAQDGLNLVTTIDVTIQSIVEKHLKETYYEHQPEGRVSCIVMDVDTGEILALAIYPNFDANEYTTLSEEYQKKLDAYEGEDEKSYRSTLLNEMWNNTIATQTYEPGSTFKVITAAMALESGSVTRSQLFNCGRQITVAGQTIHCHSVRDHGMQTIAQCLVNSCNPGFAYIGFEVGHGEFKNYFKNFGYTEKTGSDLLGEVSSIYYDTTGVNFGDVELAVYSFGQTFKVTMLQHITALSAVANGGYLVTPHVGKYLTDKNGNVVQTFSSESSRQVVSEDVCKDIMSYLVNSTKNACVSGYNVVSKTGTSEKRDTLREDDYVSSCVTFAPAADPKIAILVTVDTPNPEFGIYGSAVAAPAVGRILAEVLPHMGISPDDAPDPVEMVTVRDYTGEKAKDIKEIIEGLGLKCEIKGSGSKVVAQMPKGEQSVAVGGKVILYTEESFQENTVSVPDVSGKTPESALRTLLNKGLNVQIKGVFDADTKNCYVVSQSVEPGEEVAPGTIVVIQCRYEGSSD